jgi:predicted nucleotide-binding protein (sugar kinase/HSP70/actin superfamily)
VDENGHRVPVILLGHAFHNDIGHLNEQWKLKVNKLESVIFTIRHLATLGRQAGVIPDSEITNPGFDKMLRNFGVTSFDGLWKHNGAKVVVYQMMLQCRQ